MFEKHITDFNENILGLREFVDLIDPFLTKQFEEHDKHIQPLMMSAILKELLATKTDFEEKEKEKLEELKASLDKEILKVYKEPVEVELEIEQNDGENGGKHLTFQFTGGDNTADLPKHIQNANNTRNHIELLYKNSFISLLSSVEWFFSQILHYYYDKHPESAGIQKRTMTLADLKGFNSIQDAEKHLIDIKIEEILRGNFDSWLSVLKTELSLGLGYLDPLKDELTEIYQRRNLLVHNGGVVNSIYLSKVSSKLQTKIKAGELLSVDKEYLEDSICKLQKSFILIAAELWKKLSPDDKKRGDVIGEIIYENLLQSRWDICEGLSYFLMNDARLDPADKVVSQLNFWLCKKRTDKYSSIKKEIEKVDYSDKKEIFQLGLYALKEDVPAFFNILPAALDSRQLNIERLEEFPIFEEMRKTEEYLKFKEETNYFKEPSKDLEQ